ncbi:MAG: queuosine precursor transporter, partial [Alphaproteobacteria bacterium]|nr:queuosine precursor transporter [Alphaproteobacteria bacterium]
MIDLAPFVMFLQNLPNEFLLLVMYVFAVGSLMTLHYFLGKTGVYVYMALGVIVGNIQVLKAMTLTGFSQPVAMGTIVFMTTFLATDILAERYGKEAAQKAIWCGFAGIIFTTGIMILTLGMPPLPPSDQNAFFNDAHYAIQTLFLPAPALFIASLSSYLISQYADVRL